MIFHKYLYNDKILQKIFVNITNFYVKVASTTSHLIYNPCWKVPYNYYFQRLCYRRPSVTRHCKHCLAKFIICLPSCVWEMYSQHQLISNRFWRGNGSCISLSDSNIHGIQDFKVLRCIVSVPCYVHNSDHKRDHDIETVTDIISRFVSCYHNRLHNHTNFIICKILLDYLNGHNRDFYNIFQLNLEKSHPNFRRWLLHKMICRVI